MTRVIVDAQLRGKLLDFSEPLDLCDEAGRIVGRFIHCALRRRRIIPNRR